MKKIPSLFKRDYEGTRWVYDEIVPGCEWVLAGEGVATLKLDGTSCLVQDSVLYKRYDAKKGKTPPTGWIPCEEAPDPNTGHWPGWLPIGDEPQDQWHREAFMWGPLGRSQWRDGTYELIGPKIQGNPYDTTRHVLIRHGDLDAGDPPRTFDGLKDYFAITEVEGIVWHHPDGRMAKIKRKDFGYPWPVKREVTP